MVADERVLAGILVGRIVDKPTGGILGRRYLEMELDRVGFPVALGMTL